MLFRWMRMMEVAGDFRWRCRRADFPGGGSLDGEIEVWGLRGDINFYDI